MRSRVGVGAQLAHASERQRDAGFDDDIALTSASPSDFPRFQPYPSATPSASPRTATLHPPVRLPVVTSTELGTPTASRSHQHESHARHEERTFRLGGADRSLPLDSLASPSHLQAISNSTCSAPDAARSPPRGVIFFGPRRPPTGSAGLVRFGCPHPLRPSRDDAVASRPTLLSACGRGSPPHDTHARHARAAHPWRSRPGCRCPRQCEKTTPKLKKAPMSYADGPVGRSHGPAQVAIAGSFGSTGSRATSPRKA